jgi:hypothetical protein
METPQKLIFFPFCKCWYSGRYLLGADHKFIKYQADAHYNSRKYLTTFDHYNWRQNPVCDISPDNFDSLILLSPRAVRL